MDKMTKLLLYFSTITISILATLTVTRELYANIWWFDIPMHILGGAWVAFIFFYYFFYKEKILDKNMRFAEIFIFTIGFVAFIGVMWELWEYLVSYYFSITYSIPNYYEFGHNGESAVFDTIKDLTNDLFGGLIAIIIFYFTDKK